MAKGEFDKMLNYPFNSSCKVSQSCRKWYYAVYLLCLKGPMLKTFLSFDVYFIFLFFYLTFIYTDKFHWGKTLFFNVTLKNSNTTASRSWASLFRLSPLSLTTASEALLVLQHWLSKPAQRCWELQLPFVTSRGSDFKIFQMQIQKTVFVSRIFPEISKQNK